MASRSFTRAARESRDLVYACAIFGEKLAPSLPRNSLASRILCSMSKSGGMLESDLPLVFANRFQVKSNASYLERTAFFKAMTTSSLVEEKREREREREARSVHSLKGMNFGDAQTCTWSWRTGRILASTACTTEGLIRHRQLEYPLSTAETM